MTVEYTVTTPEVKELKEIDININELEKELDSLVEKRDKKASAKGKYSLETFKANKEANKDIEDLEKVIAEAYQERAEISNVFEAGKRIFTGFIDFITGVFTGDWERAWNGIVNIFGGIFDGIVAIAKMPLNNMIGLINGFIRGINNIKVPKWVPGVGGKSFSIGELPYLAKGGHVLNGQAIVGEAGPELLSNKNGKTTVTPLSDEEKRKGIGGKVQPSKVEQHIHIGNVDANNPSELNKMNRKFYRASKQALAGVGG